MNDNIYEIQTSKALHEGLEARDIERYIRGQMLAPSDVVRETDSGREWRLGQHPVFGPMFPDGPSPASSDVASSANASRSNEGSMGATRVESAPSSHESEGDSESAHDEADASSNRMLLLVLSAVLPGIGHILIGRRRKGALLLVVALLTLYAGGIASIIAVLDVFRLTSKADGAAGISFHFFDEAADESGLSIGDIGWVAAWLVGAFGAWLLAAPPLLAMGVESDDTSTPEEVQATVEPEPPKPECEERHAECEINGVKGRCVRGGWCMPTGPGCIHDVDCEDGNPCTDTKCNEGECIAMPTVGACTITEDESGVCRKGLCEPEVGHTCVDDEDCPEATNTCATVHCASTGKCEVKEHDDGESCATSSDAPGSCVDGACEIDRELASKRRKIDCKTLRNYYGRTFERCDKSLKYILSEDEQEQARKDIRKQIQKEMRYDVLVSLIELPSGGYNILTTNLRRRETVRGLVDPSFVAFAMAGYTKGTAWRSRQLQIWVGPYDDGWGIPTSGSRVAIEKGRSKSILGALGVVDIEAYRTWLQQNFYKLQPPAKFKETKTAGEETPPTPESP